MSFTFRNNIEKLSCYTPGFQPEDSSAIKINTNENPYPPSPKVFAALAQLDSNALRLYPKVYWDDFRKVASKLHNVAPESIVCGNGADELLTMLLRCLCGPDRPLAYPTPTYSLYPVLAAIQDCSTIEIPFGDDYRIPQKLYDTNAALTILCNPNAPTGTFIPANQIAQLAAKLNSVLAIDEAYVDFAQSNCLSLLKDFDNVVILRSMSKGYSLAGMRFGYAIGSPPIIEAMIKVKDSYNVNIATQMAATAALADQEYFTGNVKKIVDQRQKLIIQLRQLGFELMDSHTNFLLVKPPKLPAQQIHTRLMEQNIYIRYFDTEGLDDKLRITIGTAQQNDVLLDALKQILQ